MTKNVKNSQKPKAYNQVDDYIKDLMNRGPGVLDPNRYDSCSWEEFIELFDSLECPYKSENQDDGRTGREECFCLDPASLQPIRPAIAIITHNKDKNNNDYSACYVDRKFFELAPMNFAAGLMKRRQRKLERMHLLSYNCCETHYDSWMRLSHLPELRKNNFKFLDRTCEKCGKKHRVEIIPQIAKRIQELI